jgi:hypothetical protein
MPEEFEVSGTAYRWQRLPVDGGDPRGWAHHDVQPMRDNSLVTALPDGHRLAIHSAEGRQRIIDTDLTEFHGIAVSEASGEQRLWISDIGHKFLPAVPRYEAIRTPGRVVELDLNGAIHRELFQPTVDQYENAGWLPCATAVDEGRPDSTGTCWVTDGYGQNLVHRYASDGSYVATIDGSESGLVFKTPHAILLDRRRGIPELYVADRGNARIVVFDAGGRYLRTVGLGVLTSPSGLAVSGDLLFVTELFGSIAVLDDHDVLVARLGDCGVHERPGWPNALDGEIVIAPPLGAGCFNSPHGIGVDEDGSVYVSEWLIGGRVIKLARI